LIAQAILQRYEILDGLISRYIINGWLPGQPKNSIVSRPRRCHNNKTTSNTVNLDLRGLVVAKSDQKDKERKKERGTKEVFKAEEPNGLILGN